MVTALPGANAALTGLQLSGLPPDVFTFHGFLSAKSAARKTYLHRWAGTGGTALFYESAGRISACLSDILSVWGDCECALTRELTKKFEEVIRGRISEVIHRLEQKPVKGEIVLVVAPPGEDARAADDLDGLLKEALKTHSLKDAAALVAGKTGLPKKAVYDAALRLKS
jgi:16S rRNA (cytidine1402-2'-O)-methyltransferase